MKRFCNEALTRRKVILSSLATMAFVRDMYGVKASEGTREEKFATRGIVLYPFDLTLEDWPQRASAAGINTIALHAAVRFDVLRDFIQSDSGQQFLEKCKDLGIAVEYELHAMGELLSRELKQKDPRLFRMDKNGNRNSDANCNPLSETALEIIAEKAVYWASIFKPTTGRYFYWPDDGAAWCESPEAAGLLPSDQALIVENAIVNALRKHVDAKATLSHISYSNTLALPKSIKPAEGIFLEFAPIDRDYNHSISDRSAKTRSAGQNHVDPETNGGYLDILEKNLKLFGRDTAQVLEYWLDVSLFSSWTRPAKKLDWDQRIARSDITTYETMGVRHITTFATYIDLQYVKMHGEIQTVINEYGAAFQ